MRGQRLDRLRLQQLLGRPTDSIETAYRQRTLERVVDQHEASLEGR